VADAVTTVLFAVDLPPELRQWFDAQLAGSGGQDVRVPGGQDDRAPSAGAPRIRALYAGPDPGTDWAVSDAARHAPEADIVVGWRCTPEFLDAAKQLKLWIFPGVGVQRLVPLFLDMPADRRPALCNCHGNTYATAQHAVALLLALANRVVPHHNWLAGGQWRKGDADAMSTTLRKRQVGLLGYGKVNEKVHRFLSGFDVQFNVLRRNPGKSAIELPVAAEYGPDRLGEFMQASDILLTALPETPHTRGLVGADELAALGPDGLVVNVGRGPVIDEAALYHALRDGVIAGAAIDVWYDYRPEPDEAGRKYPWSPDNPFHELPIMVLSPHRAASPIFAPERWEEVVDLIRRSLEGRELINVIDLEAGY
jgi:phosphoglycerate dehydrogenase-like enzyme